MRNLWPIEGLVHARLFELFVECGQFLVLCSFMLLIPWSFVKVAFFAFLECGWVEIYRPTYLGWSCDLVVTLVSICGFVVVKGSCLGFMRLGASFRVGMWSILCVFDEAILKDWSLGWQACAFIIWEELTLPDAVGSIWCILDMRWMWCYCFN